MPTGTCSSPNRAIGLAVVLLAGVISLGERVVGESALYQQWVENSGGGALLRDYSLAGYQCCERALLEVDRQSHRYFDVTKYGAIADDVFDREAVIAALDAAHAHRGPAVVFFQRVDF